MDCVPRSEPPSLFLRRARFRPLLEKESGKQFPLDVSVHKGEKCLRLTGAMLTDWSSAESGLLVVHFCGVWSECDCVEENDERLTL